MDAPSFARQGTALRARYERAAGGGAGFTRYSAIGSAALPITRRVSVTARSTLGASSRDSTIPANYRFYLGSLTPSVVLAESQVPFAGLRTQERNGFAVAQAGVALQWEAVPNIFIALRADAGSVAPTIRDAIDARVVGGGLSVGSRTIVGPVELRLHGRSRSEALLEFNVGHIF